MKSEIPPSENEENKKPKSPILQEFLDEIYEIETSEPKDLPKIMPEETKKEFKQRVVREKIRKEIKIQKKKIKQEFEEKIEETKGDFRKIILGILSDFKDNDQITQDKKDEAFKISRNAKMQMDKVINNIRIMCDNKIKSKIEEIKKRYKEE